MTYQLNSGNISLKPALPLEIGVVEVGVAAVAEAIVGRDQRQPFFTRIPNAVAVRVKEGGGVDVGLPLVGGEVTQIHGRAAGQPDRRGEAIHQHVVPLVKDGDSPIAVGQTCEGKASIGIALGEREVLAVRITKAHVALGEPEAGVVAAAVEPFIRRPAHALGRDRADDGIGAVGARQARVRVAATADRLFAGVDDRRIGEADRHVVRSRPILLEEARLTNAEERVVGLLTVKRIGLKPLFTPPILSAAGVATTP